MDYISDENVKKLAQHLIGINRNIILIFAFNGTGKTRLSVEYKNVTKENLEKSFRLINQNLTLNLTLIAILLLELNQLVFIL